MAELITEIGVPTTPEDVMREYVGDWWPDSMRKIEAKLGGPLPPDFTEPYRSRQDAALSEGVDPVAGVIGVVDAVEAAGLKTCVASNGPHARWRSPWARRAFASASRAGSTAPPTSSAASRRPTCSPRRRKDGRRPRGAGRRGGAASSSRTRRSARPRASRMPAYGYGPRPRIEARCGAHACAHTFDTMPDLPAMLGLQR